MHWLLAMLIGAFVGIGYSEYRQDELFKTDTPWRCNLRAAVTGRVACAFARTWRGSRQTARPPG